MKSNEEYNPSLRFLAQIFSPPMFEKIVRNGDISSFEKKIHKYLYFGKFKNNLEVIEHVYRLLQNNYRCEYIFKNSILLDIIANYGVSDTLTINELKVGSSKADLVLLNGSIRIYEIKTELDDFSRLAKQIDDYSKFADKVYIVTDERSAKKLSLEYHNSNAGICVLSEQNKIVTLKEASENIITLNFDVIFKILRKKEYIELVVENYGYVPDVPNTKIFRTCYSLLQQIDISNFQKQVLEKMKERKLVSSSSLQSKRTPRELKHICNSLNFTAEEYQNLYKFLKTNSLCINPTFEGSNLSSLA